MNDLKFALRQLLKHPAFSAVAVVSLALGIGLNSAVFSIINTVFFQTIRGVDQPRRVVFGSERVSYPIYRSLRSEIHTLSGLAAMARTSVVILTDDEQTRRSVPVVSENFFGVLGVRPFLGQFFAANTGAGAPPVALEAVLDFQFWKRHWKGDPSVVGQTLSLNGKTFTVIGVAPEPFHGPGPERPPLWVPLGALPVLEGAHADWESGTRRPFDLIGRLRPKATSAQAQAEAALALARQPELAPEKPLRFDDGHEPWPGDMSAEKHAEFLLVTVVPLVVAGAILLIACSNVANLLLARAVSRRREIAIRLATGASRWRVLRLLLLESLLLATAGGALALLVSGWTVNFVFATFAEFGSLAVSVDGRVLLYTAVISLISTLLFGLTPALQATRTDVAMGLKTGGAGSISGRRGSRLQMFFLLIQIAGSMALLVITATFVRGLIASRFGKFAERADHLVLAQVPELAAPIAPAELQRQLRERLGRLPGVRAVTLLESGQGESARLYPPGTEDQTNVPPVTVQRVDAAYFRVAGHQLLRGQNVDASKPAAAVEAVVNEAAAHRFWPNGNPIEKRFSLDTANGKGLLVAGVVRDENDRPWVYRPLPQDAAPATALLLTDPPAEALVAPTGEALRSMASARAWPMVATLRQARMKGLSEITQVALLIGGLALLLAATGLYGSMAFASSQRTQEMGVRLALGATRRQVMGLLIGRGLKITAAGCAVGLGLVWMAFQLMNGLIFGKWRLDLWALLMVAVVFALASLAACWAPARRASRVDPTVALRAE